MVGLRLVNFLAAWDTLLSRVLTLPVDARAARTPAYRMAWAGAHGGDSWLWALVSALLWQIILKSNTLNSYSLWRDNRVRLATGWTASLVAAAWLTLAIKRVVRRVRPGTAVNLYGGGADVYSFPSGHAMRMGVVTVWAGELAPPWRSAARILALWVCLSRVRLGIHYLGDMVSGYLIGAALAGLIRTATRWLA